PEFSTASEHCRQSSYSPPSPASRSWLVSTRERISRLPSGGAISASMAWLFRARRDPALRPNLDGGRFACHEPDIDHVGVADGDAAVGPVGLLVAAQVVLRLVRQAVNHDLAAGIDALGTRTRTIALIGIRHVDREKEVAVGVARVEQVLAFRRAKVA